MEWAATAALPASVVLHCLAVVIKTRDVGVYSVKIVGFFAGYGDGISAVCQVLCRGDLFGFSCLCFSCFLCPVTTS